MVAIIWEFKYFRILVQGSKFIIVIIKTQKQVHLRVGHVHVLHEMSLHKKHRLYLCADEMGCRKWAWGRAGAECERPLPT